MLAINVRQEGISQPIHIPMSSKEGAWVNFRRSGKRASSRTPWTRDWGSQSPDSPTTERNDIVITSELLRQLDLVPYAPEASNDNTRHLCTPVQPEEEGFNHDTRVLLQRDELSSRSTASTQRRSLPRVEYMDGELTPSPKSRCGLYSRQNISSRSSGRQSIRSSTKKMKLPKSSSIKEEPSGYLPELKTSTCQFHSKVNMQKDILYATNFHGGQMPKPQERFLKRLRAENQYFNSRNEQVFAKPEVHHSIKRRSSFPNDFVVIPFSQGRNRTNRLHQDGLNDKDLKNEALQRFRLRNPPSSPKSDEKITEAFLRTWLHSGASSTSRYAPLLDNRINNASRVMVRQDFRDIRKHDVMRSAKSNKRLKYGID